MTLKDLYTPCLMALSLMSAAAVADSRLDEAQACTTETNRLERLACFDDVFDTPAARYEPGSGQPLSHQSERWRRAFAQASGDGGSGVIYRNTGSAAGHLVTVAALGVQPPRPVLTLQCHNNITELAVMLPEPIEDERVEVTLGNERAWWRVRDDGLVVSAGRGLPAIRTIQEVVRKPDVRLLASVQELDGLLFDLSGFGDAIRALRQDCGW